MTGGPNGPVVALRALGLGDLLTAVPALRGLRRVRPGALHVLVTSAGVAPLAARAGVADAVVAVDELGPLPLHGPVELAVNLHGRGPASHRRLRGLHPACLVGYDLPGGPPWPVERHEVDRWATLVDALLPPEAPVDRDDLGLAWPGRPRGRRTLLHPGAAAPARRWPVARWAEVARAERARGHEVVVSGGPGERSLVGAVVAASRGAARGAGRSGVLGLCDLVASAGRVVSGDTGVAHLATALGRPSVVLFGPTPPARWGPPPQRRRHVALWAGRHGDPHGQVLDPGLAAISVSDVCDALASLPDG